MKKENSGFGSLRKHEDLMLILLTVILVVFFSIMKPSFFTLNSFASIARQIPEIGLFTLAMMLPMLVGGIDLSIISTANLATVLMGLFMNRYIPKGEENVPVVICALLICAAVCLAVGFLNGVIIAIFRIPAMLVTLGMQMVTTGISLGITRGGTLSGFPASFTNIGNGDIAGIPVQFIIFLIAGAILLVILQMTSFGVRLRMYGSNHTATVFSGTNDISLLIRTHMLSGAYVALAAIIMSSRLTSASAGAAANYLMRAILIAVLGGVDPNGGKGRVWGIFWAVHLCQGMASGLNVLRVNSYIVIALYGVILLLSVFARTRRE